MFELLYKNEYSENCAYDYFQVFYGPFWNYTPIASLCRFEDALEVFRSSSREMFVEFKSDSSITEAGLSAEFAFVEITNCKYYH